MPYSVCDGLSKLIPFSPTDPWSLERTLANEPTFKERYDQDEEVHALIDLARPLEGLTRNIGMHAGGVLIAPGKLTDFCPLYRSEEHTSELQSLMRISYAVFCLKKKNKVTTQTRHTHQQISTHYT